MDPLLDATLGWPHLSGVIDWPRLTGALSFSEATPTISSVTISAHVCTVVFSVPVHCTGVTGLSLSGTSAGFYSLVSGDGTTTLVFALSPGALHGETITLDAVVPNDIVSGSGVPLAAASSVPVTNNTPQTLAGCVTDAIRFVDPADALISGVLVTSITDTLDGEVFTSPDGHRPTYSAADADFNGLPSYGTAGVAGHALYLLGTDALPADPFTVVALVKWSGSYAAIGAICGTTADDATLYTDAAADTKLGLRVVSGALSTLSVPATACVVMAVFNGAVAEVHTIEPDGTISDATVAVDAKASRTSALILLNTLGYANGFAGKLGQLVVATGDRSADLTTIHTDFCQDVLGWT